MVELNILCFERILKPKKKLKNKESSKAGIEIMMNHNSVGNLLANALMEQIKDQSVELQTRHCSTLASYPANWCTGPTECVIAG